MLVGATFDFVARAKPKGARAMNAQTQSLRR